MKMLTQYLEPDKGTIWYGNNSSRSSIDLRRTIGYLPEHNPLYEDMPVLDYLSFCASLQGVSISEIPSRVREMVKKCGLDVEKHKKLESSLKDSGSVLDWHRRSSIIPKFLFWTNQLQVWIQIRLWKSEN